MAAPRSKDGAWPSPLRLPPRCHLASAKHFTTLVSTIILALIFLASTTSAAPLRERHLHHLIGRQSIPDRFGNTGTGPGPGGLQEPEPVPASEPPSGTTSVNRLTSSTIRVVTASATTSIQIVPITTTTTSRVQTSVVSVVPTTSTINTSLFPASTTAPITVLSPDTSSSSSMAQKTGFSSTFISTTSSTAEALLRIAPVNPLAPAVLAGIITGGVVFLALLIGLFIFLFRRRRRQEIAEIPIRRSKLGSRLANRVFGTHYDERIAKSRSRNGSQDDVATIFTKRRPSSGSLKKEMTLKVPQETYGKSQGPISPSVYSPHMTMRMTRISTMTFGSVGGWLDKTTIGKPIPVPAFTGTPSQLLDAPKPLFAKPANASDENWIEKPIISPPRPARPGSAEPLGRLSGMGYGLGTGNSK